MHPPLTHPGSPGKRKDILLYNENTNEKKEENEEKNTWSIVEKLRALE